MSDRGVERLHFSQTNVPFFWIDLVFVLRESELFSAMSHEQGLGDYT